MGKKYLVGIVIFVLVLVGGVGYWWRQNGLQTASTPVVLNQWRVGNIDFVEKNGATTVTVATSSASTVPQPVNIFSGSCPNPRIIKFALASVVSGVSVTVLPITIDELKKMLPLALAVNKSAADFDKFVSCTNLTNYTN